MFRKTRIAKEKELTKPTFVWDTALENTQSLVIEQERRIQKLEAEVRALKAHKIATAPIPTRYHYDEITCESVFSGWWDCLEKSGHKPYA